MPGVDLNVPSRWYESVRILIASPRIASVPTGNKGTSSHWAQLFESMGHEVSSTEGERLPDADLLVALHAVKSRDSLLAFKAQHPTQSTVVALSGTDIYPEPSTEALDSMAIADALIILQERALAQVPSEWHAKTHVAMQSFVPQGDEAIQPTSDPFRVLVAGHLRDVKDPLRPAAAARLLPKESKIQVEHVGNVLDPKYEALIAEEQRINPRYHYLGQRPADEMPNRLRASQALVHPSFHEGGARVIGEAVVEGTPVIASRIEGTVGQLGDAYPGYFPAGDTNALAELLGRLENDPAFRQQLRKTVRELAQRFHPDRERDAWHTVFASLRSER